MLGLLKLIIVICTQKLEHSVYDEQLTLRQYAKLQIFFKLSKQ